MRGWVHSNPATLLPAPTCHHTQNPKSTNSDAGTEERAIVMSWVDIKLQKVEDTRILKGVIFRISKKILFV